jgi:hypothetical protein
MKVSAHSGAHVGTGEQDLKSQDCTLSKQGFFFKFACLLTDQIVLIINVAANCSPIGNLLADARVNVFNDRQRRRSGQAAAFLLIGVDENLRKQLERLTRDDNSTGSGQGSVPVVRIERERQSADKQLT